MPNLHKELELGAKAKRLLDDEIYQTAFNGVRQAIHDKWAASPIRDVEGQNQLRLMLKLLGDLEANIVEIANTGTLSEIQIEQEKTLAKRAKEYALNLINGRGY